MLKIGKLSFWSKFETFDREINIEHKQIPKRYLTDYDNYSTHVKSFFFFI